MGGDSWYRMVGAVLKQYAIYLLRWQLSTLTLWPVLYYMGSGYDGVMAANLVGGVIFFWVDRWIFKNGLLV